MTSITGFLNSSEPVALGLALLALVMAAGFVRFWIKYHSKSENAPLVDGSPGAEGPAPDISDWSGGLNSCGGGGD